MFGTSTIGEASEQGGIYNRSYCGIRIERLPPGQIRALHAYYMALKAQSEAGIASFQLVGSNTAGLLYA